MRSRSQGEPPANAMLGIAYLLIASLAFTSGCPSGEGKGRANSAAGSSHSSKPAAKIRSLNDRKFQRTPERLARGRYLVNGIGECFACHGPYDLNAPGWPPV
jgi:mono/diheme cytochrome c family protein